MKERNCLCSKYLFVPLVYNVNVNNCSIYLSNLLPGSSNFTGMSVSVQVGSPETRAGEYMRCHSRSLKFRNEKTCPSQEVGSNSPALICELQSVTWWRTRRIMRVSRMSTASWRKSLQFKSLGLQEQFPIELYGIHGWQVNLYSKKACSASTTHAGSRKSSFSPNTFTTFSKNRVDMINMKSAESIRHRLLLNPVEYANEIRPLLRTLQPETAEVCALSLDLKRREMIGRSKGLRMTNNFFCRTCCGRTYGRWKNSSSQFCPNFPRS